MPEQDTEKGDAMKIYEVTVPIAGHAILEVEAENEEAAIEQALERVERDDIEEWEALRQFHRGNVCYCPQPWKVEAREVDDPEDEA